MGTQTGEPLVVTQTDRRFTGPAYEYLRDSDELPNYEGLPDVQETGDWTCRVKLFLNGSRWTYYVAAATLYADSSTPDNDEPRDIVIVTGYIISPLGADCDEWGDSSMEDIVQLRDPMFKQLPVERDLHFEPTTVRAIQEHVATHGFGP